MAAHQEDDAYFSELLYQAQHFGETSATFCNRIYDPFIEALNDGLVAMRNRLVAKFGMGEEDVKARMDQLTHQIVDKIAKYFDQLEIHAGRNEFFIPSYVTLPDDKDKLDVKNLDVERKSQDAEIRKLMEEIMDAKQDSSYLDQRLFDLSQVKSRLDLVLQTVSDMPDISQT